MTLVACLQVGRGNIIRSKVTTPAGWCWRKEGIHRVETSLRVFQNTGRLRGILRRVVGDLRRSIRIQPRERPEVVTADARVTLPAYLELDEIWVHKIGRDGLLRKVNRDAEFESAVFQSV